MKYSKETIEKICKYVSLGLTNEKAARCADVGEATFYDWCKTKPEFVESLKKARNQGEAANLAIIHKFKQRTWQAAAWLLERQNPEEYGIRSRMELTGKGGAPLRAVASVDFKGMGQKELEKLGEKLDAILRPRSKPSPSV